MKYLVNMNPIANFEIENRHIVGTLFLNAGKVA